MFYPDRVEVIATIKRLEIPASMLASAADVKPSRLSDFLRHRNITTDKSERIKAAVHKIGFVWETFAPYRIILDDPQLLDRAVEDAQFALALRETDALQMLSVIGGFHV
jgi:hypothetical protein